MTEYKNFVILGGGTAGWIAASCLVRFLDPKSSRITLIESPTLGSVGVGEATIPPIVNFIRLLGIDERDFIARTNATFKLAIKFEDWKLKGHHYWHQFGRVGLDVDGVGFYHHWLRQKLHFDLKSEFTDYSPSIAMAKQNKFSIPAPNSNSILEGSQYAWHFDATLVAQYLTKYATSKGVNHIKANALSASLTANGDIAALTLDNDQEIQGDFFIDCSGFNGFLIQQYLKTGFENWSSYLKCNRAIVAQTALVDELTPYTRSRALDSGWQWRIPLQNRAGNGYVYSSDYSTRERAEDLFIQQLESEPITNIRELKFTTGIAKQIWNKNCLAIGLASGFLEPLESTSIHLIMKAMTAFIDFFPRSKNIESTRKEYNRIMRREYECIRDFIVLHYCTTQRTDSDFWIDCRNNPKPPSLEEKIDLFKEQGKLYQDEFDLFSSNSWYAVLSGMGVTPQINSFLANQSNATEVRAILNKSSLYLEQTIPTLPSHKEFLLNNCAYKEH